MRTVIIAVEGGMHAPWGGNAAVLRATVTVQVQTLTLWRAESGGGGEGEEIGVIALLIEVRVSRIVASASTDRTCTHVALSAFFLYGVTMTMAVGKA